jgi:hypothetical protein
MSQLHNLSVTGSVRGDLLARAGFAMPRRPVDRCGIPTGDRVRRSPAVLADLRAGPGFGAEPQGRRPASTAGCPAWIAAAWKPLNPNQKPGENPAKTRRGGPPFGPGFVPGFRVCVCSSPALPQGAHKKPRPPSRFAMRGWSGCGVGRGRAGERLWVVDVKDAVMWVSGCCSLVGRGVWMVAVCDDASRVAHRVSLDMTTLWSR